MVDDHLPSSNIFMPSSTIFVPPLYHLHLTSKLFETVSRGCPAAHPRRAPRSGSDAPAWPWPPWRKQRNTRYQNDRKKMAIELM